MPLNQNTNNTNTTRKFPEGFLWGASTSHFQIEGNPFEIKDRLSDWSIWTQEAAHIKDDKSADQACEFYHRYRSDLDLLAKLNLNAFRLSLNWAAICPSPRINDDLQINKEMIKFYRHVLQIAKEKNIKTFVTLFHFCLPQWLALEGGWANEKTSEEFSRFAKLVAEELGDLVDFWQTLNEPLCYAYESYITGIWPPGYENEYFLCFRVVRNQLVGHAAAYRTIHEIIPGAQVSHAIHWRGFVPKNPYNPLDSFTAHCRNEIFNHLFPLAIQTGKLDCPFPFNLYKELAALAGPIADLKDSADYLGINYYTREICKFSLNAPFLPLGVRSMLKKLPVNALGWETCPEALHRLLVKETLPYQKSSTGKQIPIYITENGYGTHFPSDLTNGDWSLNDKERCEYLQTHLLAIHQAINAGINVKGYLHWSLLDNFEWAEGLAIRFGLVRVSYPSQERTLRDSAHLYSQIAGSNSLV